MSRDVLELATSLAYLDELHQQYLQQPGDVDPSWHALLDEHGRGNGHGGNGYAVSGNGHAAAPTPSYARPTSVTMAPILTQPVPSVWPLVIAYRSRGHFAANLDPLGLLETPNVAELDPAHWGFSERDLDKIYAAIISGVPTVRSGVVNKPIGRHPSFRTKMCVSDPENGRDA